MTDLSTKKCLVVDYGLFCCDVAATMATEFGEVWVAAPWRSAFPLSKMADIGRGIEGVERVLDWEDYVDKADLIIFPDVYWGPTVNLLRRQGHRVWGSGRDEVLETERVRTKEILADAGLPVAEWQSIVGVTALKTFLEESGPVWVKGSRYRGDYETFRHTDYAVSRPWLDNYTPKVGEARAEETVFLVEQPIDGVEFGVDASTVDGMYSSVVLYGPEAKGIGYIGQTCEYAALPRPLKIVNDKLTPTLRDFLARTFMSTEVRIGEDGKSYLTDPCMRLGNPPAQSMLRALGNWPQHIWAGADGEMENLTAEWKYVAQLQLTSDWVKEKFLTVYIPDELKPYVVLREVAVINGENYVVPTGIGSVGAIVAPGDTLEEAVTNVREWVEEVKGIQIEHSAKAAMESCMEEIEKGRECGIDW